MEVHGVISEVQPKSSRYKISNVNYVISIGKVATKRHQYVSFALMVTCCCQQCFYSDFMSPATITLWCSRKVPDV